ncbi:MAG: nuclear pore complex subunit [Bacteroidetes bacterium]|nr:MAG: nuclear pore complex subunit [Bacteroidota bacterium]
MDRLEFQPTQKTPYVLLDPAGTLRFRGRSIPEDVSLFYEDILDWVIAFASSPPAKTTVDIEMEYLNSGTSKYMLRLLKKLKEVESDGYGLHINWVYEAGDDDILERGEYYASILDLEINFVEVE